MNAGPGKYFQVVPGSGSLNGGITRCPLRIELTARIGMGRSLHGFVHPVRTEEVEVAKLQMILMGDQMKMHKNARLTPIGRERLVRQVERWQAPETAARSAGVCVRTVGKWLARCLAESVAGLRDRRSSRPHRLHRPTASATVERIEAPRRQRFTGQRIDAAYVRCPYRQARQALR
jgi:leucine-zipper of insertion element IS481